jgi:succinyl-diaminopimelate desuccinylase
MSWARARVEAQREALVALVGALVAAPSPNPPGDTTGPAGVLADWLAARGLAAQVLAARPDKPNLVVTVEGTGPGLHLGFNGHLDTIRPGDEAAWTVPVWRMGRAEGRLTGLGVGNMKAGTAALALATVLLAGRGDWPGRLSFTAVADETVFGPDGAGWLLAARPDLKGDALICAEGPGGMGLAVAEKGLMWVRLTAAAPPRQGMTVGRGESPVARLATALAQIDGWNDLTVTPPPALAPVVPHAGAHGLRLSVNAGTLAAPGFVSQMAPEAVAEIDFRLPPGLTRADLARRLDGLAGAGLSWTEIKGWEANWTAPDAPVAVAVAEACRRVRGTAPPPVVRLPASDAARWRALGVPAVCFGPQGDLASGPDDWVREDDVLDCAAIYAEAALDLLTGGRA